MSSRPLDDAYVRIILAFAASGRAPSAADASALCEALLADEVNARRNAEGQTRVVEARNVELQAREERLVAALERSLFAFRRYEAMHRVKGTPEGLEKARANAARAEDCEKALAGRAGYLTWTGEER